MSRLADKDFARLVTFLDEYRMSDSFKSNNRKQLIRRGHKHCLAALQVWSIAEHLAKNETLLIKGATFAPASSQLDQLSECFSDITSSFFSALHGLYKPAHMSLRSAIETFIRSIAGLFSVEAANTTSVYRLFELARDCEPFSGAAKLHFETLHHQYGQLCNFTHSATPAHMIKNHALSNFPKHGTEHMREWVRHYEATIRAIMSILVFSNRDVYLHASPQAQDVYEEVLPREARLFALGGQNY
jgi:hypothetical protein